MTCYISILTSHRMPTDHKNPFKVMYDIIKTIERKKKNRQHDYLVTWTKKNCLRLVMSFYHYQTAIWHRWNNSSLKNREHGKCNTSTFQTENGALPWQIYDIWHLYSMHNIFIFIFFSCERYKQQGTFTVKHCGSLCRLHKKYS